MHRCRDTIRALAAALSVLVAAPATTSAEPRTAADVAPATPSAVLVGQYLDRLAAYGFSFSFVFGEHGKVTLARAYGPGLSTRSVFNLASVSKQFTATAVLKLAEDGRLRLDDPVARFLPDAPPSFAAITIDQLLAHTSGLRDDYGLYERQPGLNGAAFRAAVYRRPLASAPGQVWEYSNDGYSLLAMIVEQASGQSFSEFTRRRLFEPAGLTDAGFMSDDWAGRRPTPFGGSLPPSPTGKAWRGRLGPTAVVASPQAVFQWQQALDGGAVLRPEYRARLTEKQIAVYPPSLSYARGWWVRERDLGVGPLVNIFHSGVEDDGANAWFSRFPALGLSMVFASPQAWEGVPLREALFSAGGSSPLEALLFGGETTWPAPVVDVELAPVLGRYRLDERQWFDVEAKAPFLRITPHGQDAFNLLLPTGSGAAAPATLASATRRTQGILAGLVVGDTKPFAAAVGKLDDGSTLAPPVIHSFEVLGSYPIRPISDARRQVVTHVLLRGKSTRRHLHIRWDAEQLTGVWEDDEPVIPSFRGNAPRTFSNHHPFVRGAARVSFEAEALLIGGTRVPRSGG